MTLDKDKLESLYHTALVLLKKTTLGSAKGHRNLRELLHQHRSFEEVYRALGLESLDSLCSRNSSLARAREGLKRLSLPLRTLTVNDEEFPLSLKSQEAATPVLYLQGNLDYLAKKSIAVVGTRRLKDESDKTEGKKVLKRLVGKPYVVVSGLASGCDTLAHLEAIALGGETIAVLGTPLDKFYPLENKDLQARIAREHLLISQYPIGSQTKPYFFAERNKTMVSLSSEGIVVIRSDDNSGTLHAIRECVRQGKTVYALDRNIREGYMWTQQFKNSIKNPNHQNGVDS